MVKGSSFGTRPREPILIALPVHETQGSICLMDPSTGITEANALIAGQLSLLPIKSTGPIEDQSLRPRVLEVLEL